MFFEIGFSVFLTEREQADAGFGEEILDIVHSGGVVANDPGSFGQIEGNVLQVSGIHWSCLGSRRTRPGDRRGRP